MKNIFYRKQIWMVAALFITYTNLSAQIGINTDNVYSGLVLHIDPSANNSGSASTKYLDDVVVSKAGNVGLGTVTPSTKLHVVTGGTKTSPNPQLRIEDGTQGLDKVLTSSNDGTARWDFYTPGSALGTFDANGVTISLPNSAFANTKAKISLYPGKWVIIYNMSLTCNSVAGISVGSKLWVKSSIADATSLGTLASSADIIGARLFCGATFVNYSGLINGKCIVENTTSGVKDYYLLVGQVEMHPSYAASVGIKIQNAGSASTTSMFAYRVR